jgi:GTP pyrophosphokinase
MLPEWIDSELLKNAYGIAETAHAAQQRSSQHAFFDHPLGTAKILRDWGFDDTLVAAAILHDVMDHKNTQIRMALHDLKNAAGSEIGSIVETVKTLGDIQETPKAGGETQELAKILTMGRDPRAVLIKIASGLEHLRNLHNISEEAPRRQKAEQLLSVFGPLSVRLGMWEFNRELEDTCFFFLFKEQYDLIDEWQTELIEKNAPFITQVLARIEAASQQAGVQVTVKCIHRHRYSLFKSLTARPLLKVDLNTRTLISFNQAVWFQMKTAGAIDCYRALAAVHETGQPIPKTMVDYVSSPKPNGYSALHTAVLFKDKESGHHDRLEIKILSEEMDQVARRGISDPGVFQHWFACWKRKQAYPDSDATVAKYYVRLTQSLCQDQESPAQAPSQAPGNKSSKSSKKTIEPVQVFTPDGNMISLREGATPLDFAYRIHSEMGNQYDRAVVNGTDVAMDYVLKNGEVVQIYTSSKVSPQKEWLKFVVTSDAQYQIRRWLRQAPRLRGYSLLMQALAKTGRNWNDVKVQTQVADFVKQNFGSVEHMFDEIGEYRIPVNRLVAQITGENQQAPTRIKFGDDLLKKKRLWVRTALCCQPVYPDQIVGVLAKSKLTVHRAGCGNVFGVHHRVELSWDTCAPDPIKLDLRIEGYDHKGLLRRIVDVIFNQHINIGQIHASAKENQRAEIDVTLELKNSELSDHLFNDLRRIDGITEVKLLENENAPLRDVLKQPAKRKKRPFWEEGTIPNPYKPGRAIEDGKGFYGREQELKKLRGYFLADSRPAFCSLIAQKRAGKTSLAHQMVNHRAMKERYLPVYADLGQMQTANDQEILNLLLKRIQLTVMQHHQTRPPLALPPSVQDPYGEFEDKVLEIRERLGKSILITIDEFDAAIQACLNGSLSKRFFTALRQWTSDATLQFLIIRTHYYQQEITEYLPFFEDVAILGTLGPLDDASARKLIEDPVAPDGLYYANEALAKVLELTAGHPNFIQHLCWALVNRANQNHLTRINLEDVEAVVHELTKLSNASYFAHFWKQSSLIQQLTLLSLARATREADPWVSWEEIVEYFPQPASSSQIQEALSSLTLFETVETRLTRGDLQYRIRVPLLRQWILKSSGQDKLFRRI